MWPWRTARKPIGSTFLADECETLERLISTTQNSTLAELARLRLRAARFARDHVSQTVDVAPRATSAAAVEDELLRSSSTTTHATRSADLVDMTPRLPMLARIARTNGVRYAAIARRRVAPAIARRHVAPATRTPPLLLSLFVLDSLALVALWINRDTLQRCRDPFVNLIDWSKVDAELAFSSGGLLLITACLAMRHHWRRHHPRLLPPDEPR
jgi:hypothetical protein